jgi:hypothetical protein
LGWLRDQGACYCGTGRNAQQRQRREEREKRQEKIHSARHLEMRERPEGEMKHTHSFFPFNEKRGGGRSEIQPFIQVAKGKPRRGEYFCVGGRTI